MGNIRIKCFKLRDDIFDTILVKFSSDVKIVPSTEPYLTGYPNKTEILYDGKEYMILKEYIVDYFCDNIKNVTDWKQCRVKRCIDMDELVEPDIDGSRAYELLMKLLSDYYNEDEIEECLNSHEAEYDEDYKQYHYYYPLEEGQLDRIDNCIYYDINGAHNDALCEIFPKAKGALTRLYVSRHDNPNYKAIVNYAVGMFCRKGHRKTYNWIVQRTTKSLLKALKILDGTRIYANTDGFVISAKNDILGASSKLGEFKIAYKGEVYVYRDKNYWLMQMGKVMKGSCLTSVRKDIDLSKGQVVHYERRRLKLVDGKYVNVADNVEKETLDKEKLW